MRQSSGDLDANAGARPAHGRHRRTEEAHLAKRVAAARALARTGALGIVCAMGVACAVALALPAPAVAGSLADTVYEPSGSLSNW